MYKKRCPRSGGGRINRPRPNSRQMDIKLVPEPMPFATFFLINTKNYLSEVQGWRRRLVIPVIPEKRERSSEDICQPSKSTPQFESVLRRPHRLPAMLPTLFRHCLTGLLKWSRSYCNTVRSMIHFLIVIWDKCLKDLRS